MLRLRIAELRDEYSDVDLVVENCFGGPRGEDGLLGLEPHECLGSVTVKRAEGPRGLPQPLGIFGDRLELWLALQRLHGRGERFRATRS